MNELKDIVQSKNIETIKEFTEEEKRLLKELLKYTKNEEYHKYYIQNTEMDSRKRVLNYMYWQYKLIDKSIKIDLLNLKVLLQIKNGTQYIQPIEVNAKCNICGAEAIIFINSYNKEKDILFKCKQCNHEELRYKELVFPLKCKCEQCNKLNENFFRVLKNNFDGLIKGIKKRAEEFYISSDDLYIIDDEEMERDYKLNRCEFDKDIREVMSYQPKDGKSLIDIINKLHERNKSYNKNYKNQILDKLERLKVFYLINVKEDLALVKNDFIEKYIYAPYNKKDERKVPIIQEFLNECMDTKYFQSVVECHNFRRINFEIKRDKLEFIMDGNINCGSWYNPVYKEKLVLNKFYFKSNEVNNSNYNKTHILNIFKSQKERSLYIELKNKYKRFVVFPNYKADSIINIKTIKNALLEEEYEYLRKCYFDFIICDLEGNVLKVIELQRGKHHNEKEWIEKDNMKRRICENAGFEFEEIF
ncbi:DUF2726 domain-containing protein [Clostridium saccharoperbutylacetonicum]|uniref:DUF2726 domain-containing protein n=1 Tax=Clostridium saccharoperbutylacetonicum TaxID=36745 RepID=UPI0039EC7F5F